MKYLISDKYEAQKAECNQHFGQLKANEEEPNRILIDIYGLQAERVKLNKRQKKLQEQALEIQKYEEKIHHLADMNIEVDLDDGAKHNYALFADVLAKI